MYSTENTPSFLSASAIERVAGDVRKLVTGADNASGAAEVRYFLDSLIEKLGGKITIGETSIGASGSLIVEGRGKFTIFLSPYTSHLRDNFTIAHEIGHYFLHYLFKERSDAAAFLRHGSGQLEAEANRFAAALLMPEKSFKEARDSGDDIFEIAGRFGVSAEAAKVRGSYL